MATDNSNYITDLKNFRADNPGRRICFVSGNFKVIHPGHIRLLRFAKSLGDILFVGVLPKNEYNAEICGQDRLHNVRSLNMVDYACLIQGGLEEFLEALAPDFVVKGKEHENSFNPEAEFLQRTGGKLIFSSGMPLPSSMDVVQCGFLPQKTAILQPVDYLKRHSISKKSINSLLDKLAGLDVCVVGDIIADEYINCDPLGMSQEDPTIVVTPTDRKMYAGGAAIVAAHAAGLGAKVHFASVCGCDETAAFVRDKCRNYGLDTCFFEDPSRPTTLKQRFRCKGKTLLRVSHLRQHAIDRKLAGDMCGRLEEILPKSDLLVFSDFNYGCLPQPLVERLIKLAIDNGVIIAADSQSSSQVGDVSRFVGANLITPTEREGRLAVKDYESGLVVLADRLVKKAKARYAILTLGESGILVQTDKLETEQLPALNPCAIDVMGAGDSLLVGASLSLAAGASIWEAACLGSCAAAIQVGRQGNIPLAIQDIRDGIEGWNN